MFTRLGRVVTRHPVHVAIGWLALMIVAFGVTALASAHKWNVTDSSEVSQLSQKYESAQAQAVADRAFPHAPHTSSATLVVTRPDGKPLTAADQQRAASLAQRLTAAATDHTPTKGKPHPAHVALHGLTISPNHKVALMAAVFDKQAADPDTQQAVKNLRGDTKQALAGTDLQGRYTGDAAGVTDGAGLEQTISIIMVAIIAVLLLILSRSVLVTVVSVLSLMLIGYTAVGLLTLAAHVLHFSLDQTVTGLLPVVLFGVGTDYIVFLLFRYRERLRAGDDHRTAMAAAIARVGKTVLASAIAVAVSFSALLVSQLAGFRVLGPSLSFAVLVMLLAALTLVPALLTMWGKRLARRRSWNREPRARLANAAANVVARRPGMVIALTAGALAVLSLGVLGAKANYDLNPYQSGSESAVGYHDMQTGFPKGALAPVKVYVTAQHGTLDKAAVAHYAEQLSRIPDVGTAGTSLNRTGSTAEIDLPLKLNPYSTNAIDMVQRTLRPAVHQLAPAGTDVHVGGDTAAFVDVRHALSQDQKLIFPLAGLLIGIVLVLMLRAALAPLYLMGSVVLGFGATLGTAVLAYQYLGSDPGINFQLPLIVYLFVSSIGTDYNILMIGRLREEMRHGKSAHEAARTAIRQTGPTAATAAVILAASFGVLAISPALGQIGFSVAAGVLTSTFVMAWLLVPALTAALGRRAFWPTRTAQSADQQPMRREYAAVA